MELNLAGKTVTQALAELRQALVETEDSQLTVKTDNETVKLNLYNHVHKLGLRCTSDRQGPYFLLHLKLNKPAPGATTPASAHAPTTRPKAVPEHTAFPIGHLGGAKTKVPTESPRPKRRSLLDQPQDIWENPDDQMKPQAQPTTHQRRTLTGPNPGPSQTPLAPTVPTRTKWLCIQNDQIGNRDTALGVALLEELLEQLDGRQVSGVFLVHRGVRLLDPLYADGKLLRALVRQNLKLYACPRSVDFYQLVGRVNVPLLSLAKVLELAMGCELIWI